MINSVYDYKDALRWDDWMQQVETEMQREPVLAAQEGTILHANRKRSDDDIFQLFVDATNSPNPPSWLPNVAYSVVRYAEKKGKITEGQWRMMRKIYETLCWTDQLRDPRYHIVTVKEVQGYEHGN